MASQLVTVYLQRKNDGFLFKLLLCDAIGSPGEPGGPGPAGTAGPVGPKGKAKGHHQRRKYV